MLGDLVVGEDVRRIASLRPSTFRALDGQRILITGGTGFVGVWMLRALLGASELHGLTPSLLVLSRDPARFAAQRPELAGDRRVTLVQGDISAPLRFDGPLDLVVHAAVETNVSLADPPPVVYHQTGVAGTMHVAQAAFAAGARRLLFVSSGAVYGAAAFESGGAHEDAADAPPLTDVRAAYGNAKRAAEAYVCALGASGGPAAVIARLFAFVGPDLPLRSGFAVGNFIGDALAGGPIRIAGDGTPLRSYLYASDMALWLWTLAVEGAAGTAYNVGSDQALSIAQLAERIAAASGEGVEVLVAKSAPTGVRPNRYVPSTVRARSALGLTEDVSLDEALTRTIRWHRARTT